LLYKALPGNKLKNEINPHQFTRKLDAGLGVVFIFLVSAFLLVGCGSPVERSLEAQRKAESSIASEVQYGAHKIDPEFGQISSARKQLADASKPKVSAPLLPTTQSSLLDQLPTDNTISFQLRDVTLRQVAWIMSKHFGTTLSLTDAARALKTKADLFVKDKNLRATLETVLSTYDVAALPAGGGGILLSPFVTQTFQVDPNQFRSSFNSVAGGDLLGASKEASLKHQKQTSDQFGNSGDPLDSLVKAVDSIVSEEDEVLKSVGRVKASVSMDKVRGVLVVTSRPSRVEAVEKLLEQQRLAFSRQIDIDAQIIELEVSDGAQVGLDWALLGNEVAAALGTSQVRSPAITSALGGSLQVPTLEFPALSAGRVVQGDQTGGGGLVFNRGGVLAAVNALRTYGDVRVLASPTVRLRSGTVSHLSVGDVIRYVESIKTTINQGGTATEVNTESLFSGLNFSVGARQGEAGSIDLLVAPTQNIVDESSLAMIDVGTAGKLTLPRVRTKSISNWLNVQSGSIVIIGGLLDRNQTGVSAGVPGLSDMPEPLSPLFGKKTSARRTKELLLVLRAEVLP
jgi:MSHA type pilus biogenesis protein MshL